MVYIDVYIQIIIIFCSAGKKQVERRGIFIVNVLLISHDSLAIGMKKTLYFFDKNTENVCAIAGYSQIEDVEGYISNWLIKHKDSQKVIITDIAFGSINQIAFKLLTKFDFYLITGMNLSLVLEISLAKEIDDDFVRQAVLLSRDQIVFMNDLYHNVENDL